VDFGEALAEIAGVEGKIHFFAMDLPHSDACFVQAYPAETAEAFCDGHNAAFEFFGKVPRSILYDNTTLAVARILGDGVRQRTRVVQRASVALRVCRPVWPARQRQRQDTMRIGRSDRLLFKRGGQRQRGAPSWKPSIPSAKLNRLFRRKL
jgi:transposase